MSVIDPKKIDDGLRVTEEQDGSLTIEWDDTDPNWERLNSMTKQDFMDTIMDGIKQYTETVPVEMDAITGEYFITFPDELVEKLDWQEGDTLIWSDNYDGSFTIRKENYNGTV